MANQNVLSRLFFIALSDYNIYKNNMLHEINPCTNIVFLTAYPDYTLDAWKTEAIGFMVKPMTPGGVREQIKKLRYPFLTGGSNT